MNNTHSVPKLHTQTVTADDRTERPRAEAKGSNSVPGACYCGARGPLTLMRGQQPRMSTVITTLATKPTEEVIASV